MMVILIIGILLAITISVGSKLRTSGNKENTIATMKIVMNAVNAYYDERQYYPNNGPLAPGNYRYSDGLHGALFSISYSSPLSYATKSVGKEKLTELNEDVFRVAKVPRQGENDREVPAFSDDFGKVMLYSPQEGLGGRPVLISAGEDEMFGPGIYYYFNDGGWGWNEDSGDGEDNIRSDKLK